jgi:hypothetical protein
MPWELRRMPDHQRIELIAHYQLKKLREAHWSHITHPKEKDKKANNNAHPKQDINTPLWAR